MLKYKLSFIDKKQIAKDTLWLAFTKPADFSFKAGQFVNLGVKVGNNYETRYFTIASAPYEDNLQFVTRLTGSSFKNALLNSKEHSQVMIGEAMGQLVLDDSQEPPLVFLAGGIGITPFHSMLLQLVYEKSKQQIILFYSNRSPVDTIWQEKLTNLNLKNFKAILTMTDVKADDWSGELGVINKTILDKYLAKPQDYRYYIVGPPGFVQAMAALLKDVDIKQSQLIVESFTGY